MQTQNMNFKILCFLSTFLKSTFRKHFSVIFFMFLVAWEDSVNVF